MVNIFTDLYYLTFVQELNKSLSGWQPTILPNSMCLQSTFSHHIHPVCAWSLASSGLIVLPQLQPWHGQHSPAVSWGHTDPNQLQSQCGLRFSSFCCPQSG